MGLNNQIHDNMYWVGVNDHLTQLFESIWPIPDGISYNSYLICDEKIALLDTVKETFFPDYIKSIKSIIGDRHIDYLIVHHLEPDHAGSIKILHEIWPDIKIVGNPKTAEFLTHMFCIEDVVILKDGESLDLGKKKLDFYLTPMVHWPETMMTYEAQSGTLFSGDAFGSFGSIDGALFDNEMDLDEYEDDMLRYYSNIVGKYSPMVQKAFKKLDGLDIKMICATHGPVWKDNPGWVVERYDRWSKQQPEPGAVIAWSSMYGNTEKMTEAVAAGLRDSGICKIKIHNASFVHTSFMLRDAWRYKGLILGAPTYDIGIFPPMDNFVRLLTAKKIQNKVLGFFGTYGWSGGAIDGFKKFAEECKLEVVDPIIESRFSAKDNELDKCYELGMNIGKKIAQ